MIHRHHRASPAVAVTLTSALLMLGATFAIAGWTADPGVAPAAPPTSQPAAQPASPPASPTSASPSAPAARLFELRVYTAAPGKMPALHERFRNHTLRLFARHGIESIGYWTATETGAHGVEKLYYIVAYPDRASRERMLIQGIAVDPEFRQAVAESEKAGPLSASIDSILLQPTDYSPLQ